MQFASLLLLLYIFLGQIYPTEAAKYFVRLKKPHTLDLLFKQDEADASAENRISLHGLRDRIKKKISFGTFEGFVGEFTTELVEKLKKNSLIADITPDIIVSSCDIELQSPAPDHLARLSKEGAVRAQDRLLGPEFFYDGDWTGEGVNVYVIDTGIRVNLDEFEGRASFGADFTGTGKDDSVGHGTHVAGLIGSKTFGVAKNINLISVKALSGNGSGSLSEVLQAIEFAVKHMKASRKPGVANLSLGAPKNSILEKAIEEAFKNGLVIVAAAGNAFVDACNTSPANSPYAITVGAIGDHNDEITRFSNWGACVDLFAGGDTIVSVGLLNGVAVRMSGTSMSAPIVAGLAGILLDQGVAPEDVKGKLIELSDEGKINDNTGILKPGTPNRIANNGIRKSDYEDQKENDNDEDDEDGEDNLEDIEEDEDYWDEERRYREYAVSSLVF
ncbi:Putative subtilisin-family protease [Komagataella phaffii CBS 7435]|uniref:Peptidase S8/S53 domain-containing protein n=2 Tax=Komagataella phaffii TaxID=460519 RepID=C4QXW2_KOMPG|nr:uncharacterized protein PAS_chr1-4_0251 [Komagataella phaffii GS115]AOA60668.1 GQ67_01928T0 [Komagataella phaffii]CAH2446902.1 Putative subtilisin-family protease [Komagataella phaffii CBS 7435]AOA66754.1 GQ68_01943T0 [Komagataella phaffii GS115]CAY68085.1 Putative protein of unknown function [Komagataella phaffii GS115]CCA37160.1 Putative subtilisin-family protease [Komagataella phaffii CBS 7435]